MEIMSIRPSKDLRNNFSEILELCTDHPVAITVNGKEAMVCMSQELYNRTMYEMSTLKSEHAIFDKLAQAEDDYKLGRIVALDDAFDHVIDNLKKNYGK